ncbi:hypothetical protein F4604DRAFT_1832266 [Suillus subluteus]|nr:hypothetical protein F4604DRAFT_1832266 [Suillus subluteus]
MVPKLISFPAYAIFLIACVSLLARASPMPHAMPSESENLILLRDEVSEHFLIYALFNNKTCSLSQITSLA